MGVEGWMKLRGYPYLQTMTEKGLLQYTIRESVLLQYLEESVALEIRQTQWHFLSVLVSDDSVFGGIRSPKKINLNQWPPQTLRYPLHQWVLRVALVQSLVRDVTCHLQLIYVSIVSVLLCHLYCIVSWCGVVAYSLTRGGVGWGGVEWSVVVYTQLLPELQWCIDSEYFAL